MRDYPDATTAVNLPRRRTQGLWSWSLRKRLRRTWKRNRRHTPRLTWAKFRAKLEGRSTRAFKDLPVLVLALRRLMERHQDERVRQLVTQLGLVTPEGLGLMWYTPPGRGGGPARRRVYIPRDQWRDVMAFLRLVRTAWWLLDTYARTTVRQARLTLAAAVRSMGLDRKSDQKSDHPHPPSGSISQERDRSCSSATPGPEWLRRYERHGRPEPGASAM